MRDRYRALSLCLVVAWLLMVSVLAEPDRKLSGFLRLGGDQGLGSPVVYSILQDRQGFLWMATENGLYRYDGYGFFGFLHDPANPQSLSDSSVSTILQGKDGTLWVGTWGGGLNRLDSETGRFTCFRHDPARPESISDDRVQSLWEDPDGTLWIGTFNGGLNCLDPSSGQFRHFRHVRGMKGSLPHDRVWSLTRDQAGVLWVGTSVGLCRMARGEFEPVPDASLERGQASAIPVRALRVDTAGRLWIGSERGLQSLDTRTGTYTQYLTDVDTGRGKGNLLVTSICPDPWGHVWVGTAGDGLFSLDAATGRSECHKNDEGNPNSLSHDDIRTLWVDRSGLLWAGTRGGGLNRLDLKPAKFGTAGRSEVPGKGLGDGTVRSVRVAPDGAVWVGTERGLNCLDPLTGRSVLYRSIPSDPSSIPGDRVWSLLFDRSGRLWIGTYGGGLGRMDRPGAAVRRYGVRSSDPRGISHGVVKSILEDGQGVIWAGTDAGLDRYDSGGDRFLPVAGLEGCYVWTLCEGKDGCLWVGTDQGLACLAPGGHVTWTKREPRQGLAGSGLSSDRVFSLLADGESIWIGTASGLNRMNRSGSSVQMVHLNADLDLAQISSLSRDSRGTIWIGTSHGLVEYDPGNGVVAVYDRHSGLPSNEFCVNAAALGKDGRLYLGTFAGLAWLRPGAIPRNEVVPKVSLTALRIPDRSEGIPIGVRAISLRLGYRENGFSADFAALDFTDPVRNRFRYRLDGFDREWVEAGNRRSVTYTNLDGGSYVLRVCGANSDGTWSQETVLLRIEVERPPWLRWWAWIIYVSIAAGVVMALVTVKTSRQARELAFHQREAEQLRKVGELREEFLTSTALELKTPLGSIVGIVEALLQGSAGELPSAAERNLRLVAGSGRRLSTLVEKVLDSSRLRHQTMVLEKKAVDLRQIAEVALALLQSQLEGKGLETRNHIPEDLPLAEMDEGRMLQIWFELLEVCCRYGTMGAVDLHSSESNGQLSVLLTCSGSGVFPAETMEMFRTGGREIMGEGRTRDAGVDLARRTVEIHGGRADCREGAGLVQFLFWLPVWKPVTVSSGESEAGTAEIELERRLPTLGPDGKETFSVLVVDDDLTELLLLANELMLGGYRVLRARDAETAERIMESEELGVVVLDFMMPRISGFSFCRRIRQRYSLAELPVLMLTSRVQPLEALAAFAAGANDYLARPFEQRELIARVQTYLTLGHAVGQAIESARSLEAERKQRELAEWSRELTSSLTASLELGEVLGRLLERILKTIGADGAIALVWEQDGFRYRAARGSVEIPTEYEGHVILSRFLTQVQEERIPVLVEDTLEAGSREVWMESIQHRSLLLLPVSGREGLAAILALARREPGRFNRKEADAGLLLADQAGIAIENARLFGEVNRLATTDGLTGLFNRRHFFQLAETEFERSLRYGRPLGAIMCDIDHFKKVNDTCGHAAGDQVLRSVATSLREALRSTDILGRYGGEEFCLLLPETPHDRLMSVAERLRQSVEQASIETSVGKLRVTISLGIASGERGFSSLEALLDCADAGLYRAKRDGRNRIGEEDPKGNG